MTRRGGLVVGVVSFGGAVVHSQLLGLRIAEHVNSTCDVIDLTHAGASPYEAQNARPRREGVTLHLAAVRENQDASAVARLAGSPSRGRVLIVDATSDPERGASALDLFDTVVAVAAFEYRVPEARAFVAAFGKGRALLFPELSGRWPR